MKRFVKIFSILLVFEVITTVLVGLLFYRKNIDLTVFLNKLSVLFIFLFTLSLFATYFIVKREEEVYFSIEAIINKIKESEELKIPETDDEVLYRIYSAIKRIYRILKKQQQVIWKEKSKFEFIVNNLKEGLVLMDNSGNIELINPSAKNMLSIKDCKGNIIDLCKNYKILPELENILKKQENKKLAFNGKILILKVQSTENNLILIIEDITQPERYQEMKEKFFEEASHELKTPITSILGFSEALIDGNGIDDSTKEKFISYIHDSAKDLANLVEDILTLHRLEKQKRKIEGNCKINNLGEKLKITFDSFIKDKNLKFTVNCANIEIPIACEYIKSILWNLVDNAIKFTETGFIFVSCYKKQKSFVLEIEDTGMGINGNEKELIFERFYTSKVVIDKRLNGTGLGLSIVKHTVELLGGKIELESKKGKGSKFKIVLPIEH